MKNSQLQSALNTACIYGGLAGCVLKRATTGITRWISLVGLLTSSGLGTVDAHQLPQAPEVLTFRAGDLEIGLRRKAEGIAVEWVADSANGTLLATNQAPLFTLLLDVSGSAQEKSLDSDQGWSRTEVLRKRWGAELRWAEPVEPALRGLTVVASARLDHKNAAVRWNLSVENEAQSCGIRRVQFTQLAIPDLGGEGSVLLMRGPGEVQQGLWRREFQWRGNYPGSWCAMQFMAAYRLGEHPTGLYVGMHDPWGDIKDLEVKSDPASPLVRMIFDVPAPDMGRVGKDFKLSGEVVWQLLRGDWFDAAGIYKEWAQKEARWWPKLTRDGRADTPLWMRELCAWIMSGEKPGDEDVVPAVLSFRQKLGLPAGYHWYNWHQIPFDNDYPHYFPTKPDFNAGVAELQRHGVFVMPYINGRLWDSKDRGISDFAFTRMALPAATKDKTGKPYLEGYGSKETNGAPVSLGVMCPTTPLWQNKVSDIVQELFRRNGVDAVYVDQIAAAPPTLCMDASHDHPLGGGHWWNQGYWKMFAEIQRTMKRDEVLTTECNAEPFLREFDGYLTWHWQYDGQVPAFPAVYGGTIQMFGRAYREGSTKELATRMKAAQQLVFGEQIGWFNPNIANESENWEFVRKVIATRWHFRRYFYAGEMLRPPEFLTPTPKVKADWQWSGEWWVSTDAVFTGAWSLPREKRILLLFANVSDQTIRATANADRLPQPLKAQKLKCVASTDGQPPKQSGKQINPAAWQLDLASRSVQAFEFSW